MDPIDSEAAEIHLTRPEAPPAAAILQEAAALEPARSAPEPPADQPIETRILLFILMGKQGLRAGWSVMLFVLLLLLFMAGIGFAFSRLHLIDPKAHFTANAALFGELVPFLAMVGAAAIVALIERRRGNLLAFNLQEPHRASHFIQGLVAGFLALSALIGALAWGHWLTFGPVSLSGAQIFKFAALWGIAFLLVGCVEEGIFRCFLQSTLTRGINFWWALGVVGLVCLILVLTGKGSGIWGVYILAAAGLFPCLILHLKKTERSSFWQAAWVTSTLFGYVHTGNSGENWIGIFSAAAIGFVFVVSVRVTGSAWWAIGCHAAWDWSETYFYGAAAQTGRRAACWCWASLCCSWWRWWPSTAAASRLS
jgi:hypothetical protein